MFQCKNKQGVAQDVTWKFLNGAWVAVITICDKTLYKEDLIPNINGLNLTLDEFDVYVNWTANSKYFTKIEYQINDGEWVKLNLVNKGIGTY